MNPRCTNQRFQRYALAIITAALLLSVFTPFARSDSIGLTWAPNSESDLAGYKLYRGPSSGQYDWVKDVGLSTIIQVDNLTPNQTYYFAVTAYNTRNIESEPSNVVQFTPTSEVIPIPIPPEAIGDSLSVAEDSSGAITLQAKTSTTEAARVTLTYTVTTRPSHGVLTGTGANLTYQPFANYSGPDAFTFQVSDGTITSLPATISISVTPVNDPPVAIGFPVAAIAGTPVSFALNYSDIDSSVLTYSITRRPLYGTLTTSGNQLVYTANDTYSGSDSLQYTVSDGSLTSQPATVSFTVTARPNTAPVAEPLSLAVAEDGKLSIVLKASDRDANPLTYLVSSGPSRGTLSGNPPNLVYAPKPDFHGTDSFQYAAFDGKTSSVPVTVSITVTPVNDPPVALGLALTTVGGDALAFALDYSDIDSPSLSYLITRRPLNGTLTTSDSRLVYTANADYSGTDSLEYTVSDGSLTSPPATVLFTVTPRPNAAPIAEPQSLTTAEDSDLAITLNASDLDRTPLSYRVSRGPGQGTLTGNPPNLVYSPKPNFHGLDSFDFEALDGKTSSVPVTVSIAVTPVNDVPVATGYATSVTAGTPLELKLQASDIETTSLKFKVTQLPKGGTLVGTGSVQIYTPDVSFSGIDTLQFTASDESEESLPATITIEVKAAGNTAPTAIAQNLTTQEDTSLSFNIAANDAQNDTLTFSITSQPSLGRLTGTPPRLQYIPHANTNGVDTFRFMASDGKLDSAEVAVTIRINPVNDAPTTANQSLTWFEDHALKVTLRGMDVDGDTLSYSIQQAPAYGTITGTPPNCVYTPNTNYFGSDSFTFAVSDGIAPTVTGKVSITVRAVNDPPVAEATTVTLNEDSPASFKLQASDTENNPLTYVIAKLPSKGTLTGTAPNLVFTPPADYSGTERMAFWVSDGTDKSAYTQVTFEIIAVNDAPKAIAQSLTTSYNTSRAIVLSGSDVESSTLTYKVSRSPSRGSISGIAPNLTYKPNTGFYGTDVFEFTTNDGELTSAPAKITVAVGKPANLATPQPDVMLVGFSGTATRLMDGTSSVSANDGASDATEVVIQENPRHGSVRLAADGTFVYRHSGDSTTKDSFTYISLTDGVASEPVEVRVHVFQLTGLDRDNDQVVISFPVVAGVTYRVEGSTFFSEAATYWQVLAELSSPDETIAEVPTAALADGTSRYFRVTATDANGTLRTTPYGYQRYALQPGVRTYASVFQGMRVLETTVVSATGSTVELAASSDVDGPFNATGAFATHILVVPNTAQWWPILSNTAGQVVLSNNGADLAETLKAGNPVEIIRMPTASQVVGTAGTPDCALQPGDFVDFVNGNGFVSTLECRSSSDGSAVYYVRSQGSEPVPADASELRFLPGQPVQVQKAVASGTLWFLGRVQSNPLTQYRVGDTETNGSVSQ